MNRNTYNLIVASALFVCTIINYGLSNMENTADTRSHSGGSIFSGSGGGYSGGGSWHK